MSARFRRKCPDQKNNTHAANHWHQNDEGAPGRSKGVNIGIIECREAAKEKQIVNRGNEGAKENRAKTRDDLTRTAIKEKMKRLTDLAGGAVTFAAPLLRLV